MQDLDGGAGLIEHDDVVTLGVGAPEPDHGPRCEPFAGDHLVKHRLGVTPQGSSGLCGVGMVEHLGVMAADTPRDEERRPVDEGPKGGDVEFYDPGAGEGRWRHG